MRATLIALFLTLTAGAALAAPPEGTKLSEIIAKIEQGSDVLYIDEIDWDDDGYYEIEYMTKAGAKVEIKINPKTGDTVNKN